MEWNRKPWNAPTLLGLQFLARHLVTFNFPKRIMYLKRQSVGPLASGIFLAEDAKQFLAGLKEKGQLPGLLKNAQGGLSVSHRGNYPTYPFSQTVDCRKMCDPSIYHYAVVRESEGSPWKLQKVWRTDANAHFVEEYPVP